MLPAEISGPGPGHLRGRIAQPKASADKTRGSMISSVERSVKTTLMPPRRLPPTRKIRCTRTFPSGPHNQARRNCPGSQVSPECRFSEDIPLPVLGGERT